MEVDAVANVADDVPDKQKQKVMESVSRLASLGVKADSTVEHLTPQAQALARMAAEAKQHRCASVCRASVPGRTFACTVLARSGPGDI